MKRRTYGIYASLTTGVVAALVAVLSASPSNAGFQQTQEVQITVTFAKSFTPETRYAPAPPPTLKAPVNPDPSSAPQPEPEPTQPPASIPTTNAHTAEPTPVESTEPADTPTAQPSATPEPERAE